MPKTLTATREDIHVQPGSKGLISTWLPVVIGLCVIAIESTGELSAENTSGWLRPIFTFLFGVWTDPHWNAFHHALRKSGHFIGYGTLGMLWFRAWLRTFASRTEWTLAGWRLRSSALGVAGTFLTASADEYHQTFLPSRTGLFTDVLLDTSGALLFTLIVAMLWRRERTVE